MKHTFKEKTFSESIYLFKNVLEVAKKFFFTTQKKEKKEKPFIKRKKQIF